MIPTGGSIPDQSLATLQQPSLTWKLDFDRGKVTGMIDQLKSVEQSVRLILETERFRFLIFSSNYGFESSGVVGSSQALAEAELKRRIKEALKQDDRITDVTDLNVTFNGDSATVTFTVISTLGSIQQEVTVGV